MDLIVSPYHDTLISMTQTTASISIANNKLTPVTIFTGFLGAGKTTVISHLIDELQQQGLQVAYIKNEVGETDLDSQLIQGQNIASKALLNGCICCTLTGPFEAAIDELITTFHPDRIIIESAGTADPASLALLVNHHQQVHNDGLVTVIDVLNFNGYDDLSLIAQRQAEFTDLIVFNKVELVDMARKQAVVGYVRELQTKAPIVEAKAGRLAPELVTGITVQTIDKLMTAAATTTHLEHDQVEAVTIHFFRQLTLAHFERLSSQLPANVIRWKGLVNFDSGWKVVNGVLKRVTVEDVSVNRAEKIVAKQHKGESTLIFIGYQLASFRTELEKLVANI